MSLITHRSANFASQRHTYGDLQPRAIVFASLPCYIVRPDSTLIVFGKALVAKSFGIARGELWWS